MEDGMLDDIELTLKYCPLKGYFSRQSRMYDSIRGVQNNVKEKKRFDSWVLHFLKLSIAR